MGRGNSAVRVHPGASALSLRSDFSVMVLKAGAFKVDGGMLKFL